MMSTENSSGITTGELDLLVNGPVVERDDTVTVSSVSQTTDGGSPWRSTIRWAATVALVLSVGLLLYPRVVSPVVATRGQAMAESTLASSLYNGTAPLGGDIVAGTPVALVEIPSVGIRRVVVEGTASEQLAVGPGHLTGSVLPGQLGISAILGRSTNFGADFEHLTDVRVGDEVTTTTGQGTSTYEVLDITRRSANDEAAFIGEGNMLILMTATGGSDADGRLVVRAQLTSGALPVGDAVTSSTTTGDLGLNGSADAARDLVVWALVALVLAIAFAPIRRLFGPRVTWMITTPIVLLVVLQTLHQMALLMPSMF